MKRTKGSSRPTVDELMQKMSLLPGLPMQADVEPTTQLPQQSTPFDPVETAMVRHPGLTRAEAEETIELAGF